MTRVIYVPHNRQGFRQRAANTDKSIISHGSTYLGQFIYFKLHVARCLVHSFQLRRSVRTAYDEAYVRCNGHSELLSRYWLIEEMWYRSNNLCFGQLFRSATLSTPAIFFTCINVGLCQSLTIYAASVENSAIICGNSTCRVFYLVVQGVVENTPACFGDLGQIILRSNHYIDDLLVSFIEVQVWLTQRFKQDLMYPNDVPTKLEIHAMPGGH
ncbi:hypothetical protein EDC01DRAFT_497191 [Geopyxis carbonaria]|nr:hypothetical protein EDC01DRAFT_497191 [Geopyxis carbonaria]